MTTELKNVYIVDGTGWIPYWGDILLEDDKIKTISAGENILIWDEKTFDKIVNFKKDPSPGGTYPEAFAFVMIGEGPFTKADYQKFVDQVNADTKDDSLKAFAMAYRKQTGFGVGQREYMVAGMKANIICVDINTRKIVDCYADGKQL